MDANPPRLGLADLRELVRDPAELAKGARVYDEGGLAYLARHGRRLFADARSAGPAPYKVQVTLEKLVQGRCSCMAARSRPFCKHAAGLLIAWARAPESFAVAEAPPPGAALERKKKSVKKGKVEAAALMARGVEQMSTLLRELAVSGVASLGADREAQIRGLAEALRENRLRRLSGRALALGELATRASDDPEHFDPAAYAELFGDALLTVRKLEKHLAGEPLDDRHVEELIGKTWTKKDRKPIAELDLVEYAYISRVTPDDFVIRESRFFELRGGEHWSEKQILPAFLARRTAAKKSYSGRVLRAVGGSVFPGYAPRRLDLVVAPPGREVELTAAELGLLLSRALPDVAAALAAFQAHKKDVFAPDRFPVAVKVDVLLADFGRMLAVDPSGAALFLPDEPGVEELLAGVLRDTRLCALIGDIFLDGALPTLVPRAAIVESGAGNGPMLEPGRTAQMGSARGSRDAGQLDLHPLGDGDSALVAGSRQARADQVKAVQGPSRWVETARAIGASPGAMALGEVREELAHALVGGLATLVPRVTDALSARLRELGLAKPAELLDAVARRPDAAEKVDDLVKLDQVLGVALTRLVGAAHVDRDDLVVVAPYESVRVRAKSERISPREIVAQAATGQIHRFEAAMLYAKWYEAVPQDELLASIYPIWADGSASAFVARAFQESDRGKEAIASARRALGLDVAADARAMPSARVAKLTAIRVLGEVGGPEAGWALSEVERDPQRRFQDRGGATLRKIARRTLARVQAARGLPSSGEDPQERQRFAALRQHMLTAPRREERIEAIEELARRGFTEAIPRLRALLSAEPHPKLRSAAAVALADLGDVASLDAFVRMLRSRRTDPEGAKAAAYALGYLGDVRGVEELLDAWEEPWLPAIVAEAIREIGTAALLPFVARVEAKPELAARTAAAKVIAGLPARDVAEALVDRIQALKDEPIERTTVIVSLAKAQPAALAACAERVLALHPRILEKKATKEEKALLRKCKKS